MGNAPFECGPKEQAMFDELKHLIASEEVTLVNSIKSTEIQSNIQDKIQNNHRREALVAKLCKEKPTLLQE